MILKPFTNNRCTRNCVDLHGLIGKATGCLVTHMPSIVHWSPGFVYCHIAFGIVDRYKVIS